MIADITKRMGAGMMEFVDKPVNTVEDYNLYCHYVAGLVGIGLAKLFSASGLESQEVGEDTELANSMGLFLQKTNIIRDYLEDLVDGRTWYPREVRRTSANFAQLQSYFARIYGVAVYKWAIPSPRLPTMLMCCATFTPYRTAIHHPNHIPPRYYTPCHVTPQCLPAVDLGLVCQ